MRISAKTGLNVPHAGRRVTHRHRQTCMQADTKSRKAGLLVPETRFKIVENLPKREKIDESDINK